MPETHLIRRLIRTHPTASSIQVTSIASLAPKHGEDSRALLTGSMDKSAILWSLEHAPY